MNSSLRLAPRDLWLLALITVVWGLNWPIMKIGVEGLPPMTFRGLSMALGLPVLAAIAAVRGIPLRVPREHWRELAVLALAKELKIDADNLLGWNVYPDRVVLISMNGMKFSSALKDGRSSRLLNQGK